MKNTFTKILLCAFALLATSAVFGAASDEISSVTVSGTTFTITRSTTTYPTTVYYRTCNGSAVGGIHFTAQSGSVTIPAGVASIQIEVATSTVANTSVDAYGESASRYFYLEVWNDCTSPIYRKATLSCNTTVSKSSVYESTVSVSADGYLWTRGLSSDPDPNSSSRNFNVDMSTFISKMGDARKNYLTAVGQQYNPLVRANISAYTNECANKYHLEIHPNKSSYVFKNNSTDYWPGLLPSGGCVVTVQLVKPNQSSSDARTITFPVLSAGEDFSGDKTVQWKSGVNDHLYSQRLYTLSGRSQLIDDGSGSAYGWVEMDKGTSSMGVSLTLNSYCGIQYWKPSLILRLNDRVSPTLKSISVNTGKVYTSGEKIYLAAKFDEIVKVSTSNFSIPVIIGSTTYNFSYVGGSGTNTLYFSASPTLPSSVTTNVTGMTTKLWDETTVCSKIKDWFGNDMFWMSYASYAVSGEINIGQKYSVTLDANGGSINCDEIKSYTYGVGATLPTNVTRTGYTFAGWYTSATGGTKYASISTTATGNKTYYAHWTANTYTVTLNNQSATTSGTTSVTATYNSSMPPLSSLPVKTGYTFNGYYAGTNGTTPKYYKSDGTSANTYTLTSGTTLYAYWTVKTPSVTLSQQNATTDGTTSTTATYGSAMPTLSSVPSRTGYTFKGYYSGQNGTGAQYYYENGRSAKNCDFESAITLYPKWEVNTYTVTLYGNGATVSGTSSVTATYGASMPSITLPSRTGYTFDGYCVNSDGTGDKYYTANGSSARNYMLLKNTNLYAKWTKDTYTITYNKNGGDINTTSTNSYQYGTSVTLPTDVTCDGRTFGGWFNNANCEGTRLYSIGSTEVGDKTFYAKWTNNTYTVTLNPVGGAIQNGNVTSYTYSVGAVLPTASSMYLNGKGFAGWFTNPDYTGYAVSEINSRDFGNKVFYAKWEENVYPVVLYTNEGIINSGNFMSYTFGSQKALPTDVTRTGYEFEGWYENSSCLGARVYAIPEEATETKTYWAKWREQVYDIAFEPNEGTINDEVVPTQYTFSVGVSLPTNVSRNGYAFAGWYDNSNFEGQPVALVRSSDYGDKTYYARWNLKTFTIAFNNNGGDIEDEVVPSAYTFGDEVELPSEVYKDGYDFLGWYDNPNFYNEAISLIEESDYGNKTFYAKWLVKSYDVNFETNGGTINSGNIAKYTYGVPANLPTDVTRTGYTFAGWYSDEALTSDRIDAISINEMGEKTFYANWTNNSYAVTLNPNDGVIRSGNVSSYVYDFAVELPTDVVRVGYTFDGWFTNPSYIGSAVQSISATDYGDKEFWAKWTVNNYGVTLNTNGGTITNGDYETYTYGVGLTLPTAKNFVKTGYTFGGWYADEDFSSSLVLSIPVNETGDKEYWAKWTEIDYTITYNVNEGQFDETPVTIYNYSLDTITMPVPTREGYEFGGWYTNSSYMGYPEEYIFMYEIGNKEYWAKWNVNSYNVTLNANDGKIKSGNVETYTYGVGALLPTNVTKKGYTFAGWYATDDFSDERVAMISAADMGDKTFYANWVIVDYTITYNNKGGVINGDYAVGYKIGDEDITLPTNVTRTGYEFAGWYDNSNYEGEPITVISTEETADKELWAKWNVNSYRISFDAKGGTINAGVVKNYVYGSTVILPNDVIQAGHTFEGSYDNEFCTGDAVLSVVSTDTGDKTFYAKWSVNSYGITLVTNDGTINSDYSTSYNYGEGATLPSDITKEGYTFVGWFDNSNGDGTAYTNISDSDFGNKTFWAIWNVNSYAVTVNYDKSKGFVEGAGTYNHNRRVVLTAKSDDGQEFIGWSTESTSEMLNGVSLLDSTIQFAVTEPVELTANFRTKEYVYVTSLLTIDTLKTGVQNDPIDLAPFFKSSNDGEIFFSASSSNPSVVVAEVVDGKLFLTTNNFKGEAEITVTAKLANNEKTTLKATAVVEYDCDITIADVAITNVSCYGLADGKIELTAAEDAEYSYQWINSESTVNVIENVVAGNYQVVITDEHQCEITKTFTVSQPDEIVAEIAGFRKPKCGGTDGEITISAESEYDYEWSNGATSKDLTEVGIGNYTLKVTDPANGCFITLEQTLEYPENPIITVEAVEKTRCDQSAGAVIVSVDNDVSYNWTSAGETISTEQNLNNVPAGFYTLTVTDKNNCVSTETVEVNNFEVQVPQISLVTVSRQTGKNLIVWVRENTDLIDYYTIYRMDSAAGEYSKIGTVKYSEISVYEDDDETVNPMARQWSYKITATDICGNETAMSEAHTTLHLSQSPSLRKGYAELAWDPYVGVDYRSFYIIRETTVGNYTFIDTVSTVPASLMSYSAEIPTVGKTIYYVAIKLNGIIDPKDFMKAESGPFAIALSNIAEAENMGDPDAIESVESEIEAYAVGHTIYVKNAGESPVELYDVRGQRINYADGKSEYEFNVSLSGVYFVKVGNKTAKVLVQ